MRLHFYKYQGAGNDFVLIDNRVGEVEYTEKIVEYLCDRRFGVGADGLMLLQKSSIADFEMVYFNSDGKQASMCGNGGRCIVAFAKYLGVIDTETTFDAYDGMHDAVVLESDGQNNIVKLKMNVSASIRECLNGWYIDTGSPHYIEFVDDIYAVDVKQEGCKLRNDVAFAPHGTNVDFVKMKGNKDIEVATYERGVEDETLSCGTGVTAAALISAHLKSSEILVNKINVKTKGGNFSVFFDKNNDGEYENIYLQGPATLVYEGDIEI